jgi:hypothetical protein
MKVIWATRGRSWGFRFLRDGGCEDPLRVYDDVFSGIGDQPEAWRRVAEKGALRFPDPLGRQDRAGRVISHDFVIFEPLADQINSVEEGRRLVWDEVANQFDPDLPMSPPNSTVGGT